MFEVSEFARSPIEIFIEFGHGTVSVGMGEHRPVDQSPFWTVILGALSKPYPLGEISGDTEKHVPRDRIYLSFDCEDRAIKAIAGLVDKDYAVMLAQWNKRKAEAEAKHWVVEVTESLTS